MNGLKKTTSGFFIGTCISRRPRKKLLHKKAKAVDWEASQVSSLNEHQRAPQDSSHKTNLMDSSHHHLGKLNYQRR